jgi:RNA polymerase sigma factor (sigma-70 family)
MRASLNEEMKAYLVEVNKYPLLTREQEIDLFRRLRSGDESVREQIITSNLRFVLKIALQFAGRGIAISDLVQEGNIGLMEVVDKFDPERGFRFSTYAAFWIRQSVQMTLRKTSGTIKLPIRKSRMLGRMQEVVRNFKNDHGRQPNPQELAQLLETTVDTLEELLSVGDAVISLDEVGDGTDGLNLLQKVADDKQPAPIVHAMEEEQRDRVARALDHLSDRERRVLHLRYGFVTGETLSLRDASKHVGLSQEGVRRTEMVALKKLRSTPQTLALINGLV